MELNFLNALAWLAESRGDAGFAKELGKRASGWRQYYSAESGTLRPLNANGSFLSPFNPRQGENFEPVPGFHEGSAWNYTFYVPHDIDGLVKVMGGKRKFINKLQTVFDDSLYDPANEPDIAYPYLFSRFKGEEWRTSKIVSELLAKHFTAKSDGIPGNDDTGTMSAWAVFSMMGLYPDIPGVPEYTLTTPAFDKITITLNTDYYDKETLVIEKQMSNLNMIKSGEKELGYRISHSDLVNSQILHFYISIK